MPGPKPPRKIWRATPQTQLLVIGFLLLATLLPGVSACTDGAGSPLGRVLSAVGVQSPLPPESAQEFERFSDVFRHYLADAEDDEKLDYVGFAFRRLRTSYVQEVSDANLLQAAIKGIEDKKSLPGSLNGGDLAEAALDGMTASLDPHTSYLNPDEFRETMVQTKGEFGGLGIEVTMEDGLVKVVSPIEDTPADAAGLRSGDLIVTVDGNPIKGKSLHQAVMMMRGRPGTRIDLVVRREGVADFAVRIVRALIHVQSVKWRTEGRVAYIQVRRFTDTTEGGVIKAFAAIRSVLNGDPDGVVLDLRNNPGGPLDQSVILADIFLDHGEIVSLRGRQAGHKRVYDAKTGDLANGVPLVNGGSASASEIVARALKFHRRATVMGTQSFGKGSVQTILPLPVEGALKMTTALYYGPDGKTLQARGVAPDILIEPVDKVDRRREASLPGAIPATAGESRGMRAKVSEKNCPEIGEKKDRLLGCALAYLGAGSERNFLAAYGGQQRM